ncbi:glycosyltransferase [Aestuariibaculum sediminum]|uniref:Glycosyltransferase n=1 Tax=Aestuariibaculum sediminum TaxID=2770637 RepID=A0A8J6Q5C2_9FLAO|nr:glycosyltransferase [Aestuariibaculum sediminum]MBD0830553.1 glycosyltransferase [Aestuariibaculum sediminum]
MKISIIIPCLNQIDKLVECLKLVSKQTFKSFEVIVVDGGSSNFNLKALTDKFTDIKFISEPDNGVYDAFNKGVSLAEGDWLYFMGVDDRFYNFNLLESIVPYLKENNKLLILGQIIYEFKKDDSFLIKRNKGLVKPDWSKKIWLRNTLPHQGIFYNKNVFKKEQFDTRYGVLADYAFNLNLWKKQVPVLKIDKVIAFCGTQGLSKNYNYRLYKEEACLKTRASSVLFMPIFIMISAIKFGLKNYPFRCTTS